jgi:predicted RNase H-like HicB family nuclease
MGIVDFSASHISAQINRSFASTKEPMKQFKIVIEKHPDGYVAYPIGVVGAIVGQGDTYEEALSDVKSAIACYIEIFGKEMLEDTPSVEVFIAEAGVAV